MQKKGWLVLLVFSLTLVGCAMPSALSELIDPTPTAVPAPTAMSSPTAVPPPTTVPQDAPTPTQTTAQATPVAVESLMTLEQEIIEVYESVGMGVVNITNLSLIHI